MQRLLRECPYTTQPAGIPTLDHFQIVASGLLHGTGHRTTLIAHKDESDALEKSRDRRTRRAQAVGTPSGVSLRDDPDRKALPDVHGYTDHAIPAISRTLTSE